MVKSKDDEHNERNKRSSHSSPRGADEERTKKRKSEEEEEEKEKNHKSKKKHKSHKSSKHRSDKDKKSGEKRKDKDKSRRKHDKSSIINFQELSNDDYFSKNNEFAMWLKEEKDIFFSELSSDSARSLFSKFVKEWNNQKLEPQYYEGIAAAPRTTYNWNIKK